MQAQKVLYIRVSPALHSWLKTKAREEKSSIQKFGARVIEDARRSTKGKKSSTVSKC